MLNRTYRRTRRTARHARRPVTGRRRLAVAAPGLALITIATLAALAGCSGGASSESSVASAANGFAVNGAASSAAVSAPEAAPAAAASSRAGNGQSTEADKLVATGQQLIYTASLTVRAHSVSAAVSRATAIAAGEGGYVSSENASNDPNHPDQSTATVELKIPVALYSAALHDLTQPSLGTQLSLQQQTQDVTEQVANVNSRVTSDEAAIAQLQSLLKHAGTIGGLLSVQEQINSQESDLEAMQAQQSSLNRETTYATVTLTVLGPRAVPKPAKQAHTPGLVSGLAAGWHAFRTSVSWLLAIVGAVAPFAAIIAAIAGLAYLGRRRFIRRGRRAGTAAAGSSADS
jgi:Domain of unknown function (DUF4349)